MSHRYVLAVLLLALLLLGCARTTTAPQLVDELRRRSATITPAPMLSYVGTSSNRHRLRLTDAGGSSDYQIPVPDLQVADYIIAAARRNDRPIPGTIRIFDGTYVFMANASNSVRITPPAPAPLGGMPEL